MDYQKIEKILEKYWEGNSTLEEEKRLKDFFTHQEVPEHLKKYIPLFQYYVEEGNYAPLGNNFEEKVMNKITSIDSSSGGFSWQFVFKIAASLLIIAALGAVIIQNSKVEPDPIVMADTFDDPEVAYDEMKKALAVFSSQLNKGTEKLSEIAEFNKPEEILNNP